MSNKTPKASVAKTASAPKYILMFLAVLGIIAVIGLINLGQTTNRLTIGGQQFNYEVARTDDQRTLGLSGRSSLPNDSAMLFVFDTPAIECFWMKDMNFPLDIIWLDNGRSVVHIEQNLSPQTYPNTYCGASGARYVIEVNAGVAQQAHLAIGDKINF